MFDQMLYRYIWSSMVNLERLPNISIKEIEMEIFKEFFHSFSQSAGFTIHIENIYGQNTHHIIESCFKSLAISVRDAVILMKEI